jgi:hypothetical protein
VHILKDDAFRKANFLKEFSAVDFVPGITVEIGLALVPIVVHVLVDGIALEV